MRRALATATGIVMLVGALSAPAALAHGDGGPWAKELIGNEKDNTLTGGSGNDFIRGKGGSDTLTGAKGKDRIIGGIGADLIRGGNGHDDIFGGKKADTLIGGDGNDYIKGGPGKDSLKGGSGNDTLIANGDGAADFVNCGPGNGDKAIVDPEDTVTQCETVTVK